MTSMRALEQADLRRVPQSVESEQALLGAVLRNNDVFRKIHGTVENRHFHDDLCRRIYKVIEGLVGTDRAASVATITAHMGNAEIEPGVPLTAFLAHVLANAPRAADAMGYARTIRDLADKRRIISLLQDATDRAFDAPVDDTAEKIINDVEAELEGVRPPLEGRPRGFRSFGLAAEKAVKSAEEAYRTKGKIVGVATRLERLDRALGGLQPSDLVILGGRPGSGKTSLATNVGFNVAETGGVVGMFSLEMDDAQVAHRVLAERSRVSSWRLRNGAVHEDDLVAFIDSQRELRNLPLFIDDEGGLSLAAVTLRARDLKRRHGLALLIIDYIQLMTGMPKQGRDASRYEDMTQITMGLKALAKELEVPIIALSQLSREVEKRDDKRPRMSDLRDSGSIEQDADMVLFVFREEYYLRSAEPREGTEAHFEWQHAMWRAKGRAEVIIAKQRHGPPGTVELGFEAELTRFSDEVPDPGPEPASPERDERRKKQTPPTKEAENALGLLRGLVLAEGAVPAEPHPSIPKGVQVVSYSSWKEKVVGSLLDPGATEAAGAAFMKGVVNSLIRADRMGRGGPDYAFVWLAPTADR